MRTNKWSATVALVTLLLAGGTMADPTKARAAAAQDGSEKLDRCCDPADECNACDPHGSAKPADKSIAPRS